MNVNRLTRDCPWLFVEPENRPGVTPSISMELIPGLYLLMKPEKVLESSADYSIISHGIAMQGSTSLLPERSVTEGPVVYIEMGLDPFRL